MKRVFLFCLLICSATLFAHEEMGGRPTTWFQWVGSWHLIFLHFPIALINMLVLSEILHFENSSRFLLLSAAVLTPITSALGLLYSYSFTFEGTMDTFLHWHMWFGIATAILAILAACLRGQPWYYLTLGLLFIGVNVAGFFGGGLSFGPEVLYPP